VAVTAVFFDVGETLVDEERWWRMLCEAAGLQPHVVWAALGVTIARGQEHDELWSHLGVAKPDGWWQGLTYELDDLYPDAIACLEEMRALGLRVGVVGNQTAALERWARESALPADVISSSESLGVRKPDRRFFEEIVRLAEAAHASEVAYVGDRVDNDVLPALAAGLAAVHVRRGPWGRLQRPPEHVPSIESLAELPRALASLA
jgi:HAD superfamily hydrolase (TIGR01662 family)